MHESMPQIQYHAPNRTPLTLSEFLYKRGWSMTTDYIGNEYWQLSTQQFGYYTAAEAVAMELVKSVTTQLFTDMP